LKSQIVNNLTLVSKVTSSKYLLNKFNSFYVTTVVSVLAGPWANIKTSRKYRTWTIVNNRFCWLLGVVNLLR